MRVHYLGDALPSTGLMRHRALSGLVGIVIHRFGGWARGRWVYPETVSEAEAQHVRWRPELAGHEYDASPHGVARFALEVMGWSRHPYTIQIWEGALIQTAPLDVSTPHAGAFNRTHIGVMVTGDHRHSVPPEEDLEVAAAAVAQLCLPRRWHPSAQVALGRHEIPRVLGHDELPAGGTATPGKRCPGAGLDMRLFRDRVAEHLDRLRDESLADAGFILT